MKKIIKLTLTALLLIAFAAAAFAESAVGYTPTDVMEWYLTDPNDVEMTEQAANVASRVVENLVYVASLNANDEQLQRLTGILEAVDEVRANAEVTADQKLGVNCVYIVQALNVLCNESDPEGVHADTVQGIIDQYNEIDATVDTPEMQTVYALFTAIKLAAVVTEECCSTQEQIDQIEAGLSELDAENEAAEDVYGQMVVGSKWLRKLLGAFSKLNNTNCIAAIEQEMELRKGIVAEMTDPMEITNQYLTSSMFALGLFTGDYSL